MFKSAFLIAALSLGSPTTSDVWRSFERGDYHAMFLTRVGKDSETMIFRLVDGRAHLIMNVDIDDKQCIARYYDTEQTEQKVVIKGSGEEFQKNLHDVGRKALDELKSKIGN